MSETASLPIILAGADHGGFARKQELTSWLQEQGYETKDCGAFALDPDDDYPQFAQAVAREVLALEKQGVAALGVLLCRSGAGMVMAANRFAGVRAAAALSPEQAAHARAHNNANILVLSGDWLDLPAMQACLTTFLTTPFSAEPRHQRRIEQLDSVTHPA